ncbi:hypothetical protein B9Z31_05125 [Limnohabitans sp. G3-2]|nr:hypothetical protein B9Z31_05125 [Limnohabitans sp. G3-2]
MLLACAGATQAQTDRTLGDWQLSAGWQNYSEAKMQLKGPELGLHWQSQSWGPYSLEADALLGLQDYSSAESGRMNRVPNIDTRWRAFRAPSNQLQWQYGLALHTHANFLRGTSSLGFVGYDRLSTQWWLPVRWQSVGDQRWIVDAGWLLWGEHVSRLSQASSRFQDVTHTQRKGAYVRISQKFITSQGELEPYARWTWVDDSNVQIMHAAGQRVVSYEPENTRLQVGVKWRFR